MTREIKFRGKRVDNGEWVSGCYFTTPLTDEATGSRPEDGWYFLSGRARHCISKNNCVYEVIPESVGQWTGLYDKNGKEIYEGDILKEKSFKYPLIVVFDETECGYFAKSIGTDMCYSIKGEVIGNIYENPSLLEVQP